MHLTVLQCSENLGKVPIAFGSHGLQHRQGAPDCMAGFTLHEDAHVPGSDQAQSPSHKKTTVLHKYPFFWTSVEKSPKQDFVILRTWFKFFLSCNFLASSLTLLTCVIRWGSAGSQEVYQGLAVPISELQTQPCQSCQPLHSCQEGTRRSSSLFS